MPLIRTVSGLPDLATLPPITACDSILVASPEFFDVEPAVDPRRVAPVDRLLARQQWRALVRTWMRLGHAVEVLPGAPLLPDHVFTASFCLPVPPGVLAAGPAAVASIMRSARRQGSVRSSNAALEGAGALVEELDAFSVRSFEGAADASWHPNRAFLFGGLGPRTDVSAFERLAAWTGVPLAVLALTDARFPQLQTCLAPIDSRRALYFPGAFDVDGRALIDAVYPDAIAVGEEDALNMACNARCPDGAHVLIQSGSARAEAALRDAGLEIIALETSEFMKAGGSVGALGLQFWAGPDRAP